MALAGTQLEIFRELNEIAGPAGRVRLEPQASAVLSLLASQPGRVWSRDELLNEAWAGRVVTDATLSGVISRLRSAFKQAGVTDVRIETRSKRGYRLVVSESPPFTSSPSALRRHLPVGLGAILLLITAFLLIRPVHSLEGVSLAFSITLPDGEEVAPLIWLEEASEGSIHSEGIEIRVVPHLEDDGLVRLQFQASNLSHWAAFEHVLALGAENQFTLADSDGGRPYRVRFKLQRGKPPQMTARH